tara:strand:+ start:77576 stop:78505 length:930 start_codon:yes stop_codon:yes gene_type:complete
MKTPISTIFILCLFFTNLIYSQELDSKLKYLGQAPPTVNPKIFAPNFISTQGTSEFGSVFNQKATEFYYGVEVNGKSEIRFTRLEGNSWSKPKTLLSHPVYSVNDPFLSPDEKRLYFISQRSIDGLAAKQDYDIWYIERDKSEWSLEMVNAGPSINSNKNEYYISFTVSGDIYFASNRAASEERQHDFDIYFSKNNNHNSFQLATPLNDSINTNSYEADVFIDPNEEYLIFCTVRKEGFGQGDLYISFKNKEGSWSKSQNMGELINTPNHELCPFVSKDGKYLFFTSNQDIYWVDSKIIQTFKPTQNNH